MREPTKAVNPRSSKRRAPSTPVSSPTAAASDYLAKKARKGKEKQVEEKEEAIAPGDAEFLAIEAPTSKYANE